MDESLFSCATLAGDRVFDAGRNEIGRLLHVMIDVPTGRVEHAVVGRGGVFGIGAQLVTLPWSALTHDVARQCFILDESFPSSYRP